LQISLQAIEDDIRVDLAKVGITVNTRLLAKDAFNTAMVAGDFNMAFSESWGAPYDPQAFAASWATKDEVRECAKLFCTILPICIPWLINLASPLPRSRPHSPCASISFAPPMPLSLSHTT